MRPIKFRGKRIDTGEWVYGEYISDGTHHFISATGKWEFAEVDPATVSEFTGLLDRNGVNIYEGSIMLEPASAPEDSDTYYVVRFGDTDEGRTGWYLDWYGHGDNHKTFTDYFREFEVIGNTTDNPELIKGTN